MNKVCPVCNEIKFIIYTCEKCGGILKDKGRVQEYLDDYSADREIIDSENYCLHYYECKNCGKRYKKKIKKIRV